MSLKTKNVNLYSNLKNLQTKNAEIIRKTIDLLCDIDCICEGTRPK